MTSAETSELEADVLNGLSCPFSNPASVSTVGPDAVGCSYTVTVDAGNVETETFAHKVGTDGRLVEPRLVIT